MKIYFQTYLLILMLVFIGCTERRQKIVIKNYTTTDEVIYEKQKANFYFSKRELIAYCEKQDFNERNNFVYKQVIQYLKHDTGRLTIISDTLGTELVPDSNVNFHSKDGTLIRVRDQKSVYAYVTDAMDDALLNFASKGQLRVYDKTEHRFASFIVLEKVDKSWYGTTNIRLPSDSIVFSDLRWIK